MNFPNQTDERKVNFAMGEEIFAAGDPGGDLLFIEEGTVEIHTNRDGQRIVFAYMHAGEILGMMTCLTNEPRTASASAKTAVVLRKIPHENITRLTNELPEWMKIMLKEYTIRIKQMDESYANAMTRIKKLQERQIGQLYTACQLAASLGVMAKDGGAKVVVEDVMERLETTLIQTKEDLNGIVEIFLETGILKAEAGSGQPRTTLSPENTEALQHFLQFVDESKRGAKRRLLKTNFSSKELRVLNALATYGMKKPMADSKFYSVTLSELAAELKNATGTPFEMEALKTAIGLKLLTVEGQDDKTVLQFSPMALGRTIACIEALRKLTRMDTFAVNDDKAA